MEVGGRIACCPDSLGSMAQIHWGKSRRGTEVLFSPASAGIVWKGSTIKNPFRGVSHFISFERKGSNTVLVTKQLLSLPALKLWSSLRVRPRWNSLKVPEEATVSLRNIMFCPRLCRAAQLAQLQWEGDGAGRSGGTRNVTKEGWEAEGGEIQENEREKRKIKIENLFLRAY